MLADSFNIFFFNSWKLDDRINDYFNSKMVEESMPSSYKNVQAQEKNHVWHSRNFILPYSLIKEIFIN